MGLYQYEIKDYPKTERITRLIENLYAKMPEIESARAKLITESYKATEDQPIIKGIRTYIKEFANYYQKG